MGNEKFFATLKEIKMPRGHGIEFQDKRIAPYIII